MATVFTEAFKVRDYECDMQGVVNNSVYQNYLEHARHEYLLSKGVSFAAWTEANIHLVVVRAELDYLKPLVSGDSFDVTVRVHREGRLRLIFTQDIIRHADGAIAVQARIVGTALKANKRPYFPDALLALVEDQ